jgi:hypothetical protein
MATSGITIYQLTRDELIIAAIGKLGVLAQGQTPTTEDMSKGALFLNTAIAELRTKGMPLWARNEYTFNLTTGVSTYRIGVGQTLNTPYPLKMIQAYSNNIASPSARIQLDIIANYNYNYLPVASSSGSPVQMTYQAFVNYGDIKVWPTPDASAAANQQITIIYQRPTEYMTGSTNTFDIPEEWYNALIYKLASLLAPDWGLSLPDRQALRSETKELIEEAVAYSSEDTSIYISPGP